LPPLCGLDDDLGENSVRVVLKNRLTRMKFLSDPTHRIRFAYLSRHTSWLNQIEIWCGLLRRKVTRLGNFASLTHLCDKITHFITYYNAVLPQTYKWTCTGRTLCK
jgi:hypothetical protein